MGNVEPYAPAQLVVKGRALQLLA